MAETSFLAGFDLHRRSSAEDIADHLRDKIFSGELKPGTALREQQLSEQLGVSRQIIREALQWLAHDGIIEHLPYRGTTVRRLTEDDARELNRVRELLEMAALDAAIEGEPSHREALDKATERLEAALANGSRRELTEADASFHRTLVAALESPRIDGFYSSLIGELLLVVAMTDRERWQVDDVVGVHRQMADAVSAGDRATARRVLRKHLERSLEDSLNGIAAQAQADPHPGPPAVA